MPTPGRAGAPLFSVGTTPWRENGAGDWTSPWDGVFRGIFFKSPGGPRGGELSKAQGYDISRCIKIERRLHSRLFFI